MTDDGKLTDLVDNEELADLICEAYKVPKDKENFEKLVDQRKNKQGNLIPLFVPSLLATKHNDYVGNINEQGAKHYVITNEGKEWINLLELFTPKWIWFGVVRRTGDIRPAFEWLKYIDELIKHYPTETYPQLPQGQTYEAKKGTWRKFEVGEINTWLKTGIAYQLKTWGLADDRTLLDGFRTASRLLEGHPYVYQPDVKMPDSKMRHGLVAFSNGTYDFYKDALRGKSKDYYLYNYHKYDLDFSGKPAIETNAMLEEMLTRGLKMGKYDNDQLAELASKNPSVKVLKEYIGYCFFNTYEKLPNKFMLFTGKKGNGKSTLIELISNYYLDGKNNDDNAGPIDITQLTDPKNRFVVSTLYGKELAYDADIGPELLQSMARIKKLTGGDGLPAEFKGAKQFTLHAYAKLIFSANDLPAITSREVDGALADRAMVLPFFNPDTRNDDRAFWQRHDMDKVKEERPQFVYECLQAFQNVMKRGFTKAPEIELATKEWLTSNDNLEQWLESLPYENLNMINITKRGVYFLDKKEAYKDYTRYCDDIGIKPYKKPTWESELKTKFDFYGDEKTRDIDKDDAQQSKVHSLRDSGILERIYKAYELDVQNGKKDQLNSPKEKLSKRLVIKGLDDIG